MREAYLISVALKSTIVLAAGWVCLRSRSAATRHLTCLAALVCAATVPLLAMWQSHWTFVIPVAAFPGEARWGIAIGHWHWPAMITLLWALGTAGMLMRAAGGWILLMRARGQSLHFQDGKPAEIRIANVTTPFACGVFRPMILLPRNACEWGAARLRAVLLHESAHVMRRDCLAKYVAQVSRALLWWNPLAWILAARMNQEQELACDDVVMAAGVAPDAYADLLLETARECSGLLLLGCGMSGSSVLRTRLEYLLGWRPETRRTTRRTAVAIPLLLALMTGVSCAAKRMPQASIAPGTNLVTVPNARGAGTRPHK